MGCGVRIGWRRAIGWIAAYALALQTIAGGIDLTQSAAAAAAAASSDSAAVICHGHDGDGAAAEIPGKTGGTLPCGNCGCCLGAPPLLAAPSPVQSVAAVVDARDVVWPAAETPNLLAVRHPSQPARGPPPRA